MKIAGYTAKLDLTDGGYRLITLVTDGRVNAVVTFRPEQRDEAFQLIEDWTAQA